MQAMPLSGTYTAIVTPFTEGGERVDERALELLIEDQIKGGVTGIVPCGTTGESPTLTDDEQLAVIRASVEIAKGRCAVLAGTGSFSTDKTVKASRAAEKVGAQGVMVVMPYYNKPSQDGLAAHVLAAASAVSVPVVLYNVPGRSVVDLLPETIERIAAAAKNVVAIKEATGNVLRCQEIVRRLGDRITVLCGDDALTVPMMSVGATGVISVTSNVRPALVSRVTDLVRHGRFEDARKQHFALLQLHGLLFEEPNPAPVKAALALEQKMSRTVRGPLVPCSAALEKRLAAALAETLEV